MSRRGEVAIWVTQRATAVVLALCVVVHLGTIIYAVRAGLTAAEILARTRGSTGAAFFYSAFALAVAAHGAIGLRTIAAEWLRWKGRGADAAMLVLGLVLAAAGLRAVFAVVAA